MQALMASVLILEKPRDKRVRWLINLRLRGQNGLFADCNLDALGESPMSSSSSGGGAIGGKHDELRLLINSRNPIITAETPEEERLAHLQTGASDATKTTGCLGGHACNILSES